MSNKARPEATRLDRLLWWLVLSVLLAGLVLIVLKWTNDLDPPLTIIFVLAGIGFGVTAVRPSVVRARPWGWTWL